MSSRKLFSIFSNSYTITFSSFDHTIPVPTNTQYIQMNITSNAGGALAGMSEVAFRESATPVPWETDALPVIGSVLFFAGGVWAKRKLAKPLDKE